MVIGTPAGGLDALTEMVRHFEKGLDVAYCSDFVVHRLR